jgi:hypothetical protein
VNNSLPRLIDGMIATLREDIAPRVADEYARGQALALVDLLGHFRLRLDWAVPVLWQQVDAQRRVLAQVAGCVPDAAAALPPEPAPRAGGTELLAHRDRLDALLVQARRTLAALRAQGAAAEPLDRAEALLAAHVAQADALELTLTAKPMFGEIARPGEAGPPT